MAKKGPETRFSDGLREDLRRLGFRSYKRWGGVAFTQDGRIISGAAKGMPDLEVVGRGRRFDVETKAKTGTLEADQIARIAELRAGGGIVFVVRPANREQFMDLMGRWAASPLPSEPPPAWTE